jgi:two-component system sensor histidine kinase TctE
VLAGSALAIAERVVVAEDGSLQVDIPYVALEMLTSAAQDRVFYRVDGPPGGFITGYQALPVLKETQGDSAVLPTTPFRGEPIRSRRSGACRLDRHPLRTVHRHRRRNDDRPAPARRAILLRSALRLC